MATRGEERQQGANRRGRQRGSALGGGAKVRRWHTLGCSLLLTVAEQHDLLVVAAGAREAGQPVAPLLQRRLRGHVALRALLDALDADHLPARYGARCGPRSRARARARARAALLPPRRTRWPAPPGDVLESGAAHWAARIAGAAPLIHAGRAIDVDAAVELGRLVRDLFIADRAAQLGRSRSGRSLAAAVFGRRHAAAAARTRAAAALTAPRAPPRRRSLLLLAT